MDIILPPPHPMREALNEELHSHPYEPLTPPERILFLSMLVSSEERALEETYWKKLTERLSAISVEAAPNRMRYDFGVFRLKIERHIEFTRYKFVWKISSELVAEPLTDNLIDSLLPEEWLKNIPGKLLNALNIALFNYPAGITDAMLIKNYESNFDSVRLSASHVGRSGGLVMTDFCIKANGMVPMLVFSKASLSSQNGRLILRLVEIDTYRSLAMLALPAARDILERLPVLEGELATLTEAVASGDGKADEPLLVELTSIAARVERMTAANSRQLSASAAYFNLVTQRLKELREEAIPQITSLGGILERRLEPARTTCDTAATRLEQLSHRVAHASQLLRTRIEVRREEQNQALLISMNERFRSQLRLQEAAELLSFVIVPYYGANLLTYLLEAIGELTHIAIDPLTIKALSVPLIIVMMLIVLRRMHKHPPQH